MIFVFSMSFSHFLILFVINGLIGNSNQRKYVHSKQELETTKLPPIINAKPCDRTHPFAIFVKSAAQVSGKYYDKRQSVRETWFTDAKALNISAYFVLALNSNETVNELIKEESNRFNDIIQMNFIDHYYNLTLKTVSIYRWIQKNCQNSDLNLKNDDDVIVNIERLIHKSNTFKSGIYGYRKKKKNEGKGNKNHIPEKYLNGSEWLPEFVYGGAYIFTTNVIGQLLNTLDNYSGYVLDIDDVFTTGFIAEEAGIKRYLSKEISYTSCGADNYCNNTCNSCKISSLIALVQCNNANETIDFYANWRHHCPLIINTYSSTEPILLDKCLFSSIILFVCYLFQMKI